MSVSSVDCSPGLGDDFSSCQQSAQSLTINATKTRDHAALFFYCLARSCTTPLWKSTSLWLEAISNYKNSLSSTSQKISSAAKSVLFSSALLPLILSGLALGQMFHYTAFNLATAPYIHLKGDMAAQNPSEKTSLLQLNCCLTAGGFARLFGGLAMSEEQRVEEMAKMIKESNPDVACLQEVSDLKDGLALYRKLSSEFAEFYLNIGSTPWVLKNNSGLFVASKHTITNPQFHSFADISGTEGMVNKGYFAFRTDAAHFINTHLSPSKDDFNPTTSEIQTREEEQQRILKTARKQFSEQNKPVLACGDYNTDQGHLFEHCTARSFSSPEAICATDTLVDRNWHHDTTTPARGKPLDHLLSLCKATAIHTRVIPTFDVDRPQAAISDHPALLSEVTLT